MAAENQQSRWNRSARPLQSVDEPHEDGAFRAAAVDSQSPDIRMNNSLFLNNIDIILSNTFTINVPMFL